MDSFSSHGRELRKIFYKFVDCQLSSVKYKFAHLQLFNVKYKFLHLQLFAVKFLFSEKPYISQAEENGCFNTRPYFRILNSLGKMMTCYLRDTNKFLRYRTQFTSIL